MRGLWPNHGARSPAKRTTWAVLVAAVVLAVRAAARTALPEGQEDAGWPNLYVEAQGRYGDVWCGVQAGIECSVRDEKRQRSPGGVSVLRVWRPGCTAAVCVCVWAWLMSWGERPERWKVGLWVPYRRTVPTQEEEGEALILCVLLVPERAPEAIKSWATRRHLDWARPLPLHAHGVGVQARQGAQGEVTYQLQFSRDCPPAYKLGTRCFGRIWVLGEEWRFLSSWIPKSDRIARNGRAWTLTLAWLCS